MTFTMPQATLVEQVREALRMPHGGDRNIVIRAVLEQVAPDLEVGFIDSHGNIQTRCGSQASAEKVQRVLRQVVGADGIASHFQRGDGQWVAYSSF